MLNNLNAASKGIAIVKNLESYWKAFQSPETERRIRIAQQDYFSKSLTLNVSNEILHGSSGNMLGNKVNAMVEISLITSDGSIIYRNQETNNI